jgi:SAM-dependent methyltransferase
MITLEDCFSLPKYKEVVVFSDTIIHDLPWTPKKYEKFKQYVNNTFDMELNYYDVTVYDLSEAINQKYCERFWGGIWQPRTEDYQYTGWSIVDRINKQNPVAVLDIGCGYNQFKSRIKNLTGIDAYNNCADYMVDVLDYNVPNESYDHIIAFGSINFGNLFDIEKRMQKAFDLLKKGGTMYMRVNPGTSHKNGPWIDIFEWSFEHAYNIAQKMNVELVTFKVDNNRFYIEYKKL